MTIPTEKTISDALPWCSMALCTTTNPISEAIKQMIAKMRAVLTCSMPRNKYCTADMVEEKNTMNEQVAAVICLKKNVIISRTKQRKRN